MLMNAGTRAGAIVWTQMPDVMPGAMTRVFNGILFGFLSGREEDE